MDTKQIYFKIKHLPYYLYLQIFDRKRFKSGLKYKELDKRNFKTSYLGWSFFGYTPKNQRKVIEPLIIFNQGNLNCCVFCGTISHKIDEEKVELDISDAISYARRKGWTSGDGFANVDTCFKVLKEYGCREGKNPEILSNWSIISNKALNTTEAEKHKIKSYWEVDSRNDILKLLDEGKTLNTGIKWYTGFNQSGGFSSPWYIDKPIGYYVGGHDIKICGYDLNYNGKKVYIILNSYGKSWGNNGKFYIDMDYFDKNNYGVFTSLDMDAPLGDFLNQYDGKNVKGKNNSTIYFIQKGKKKPYLHEMDYFVYNVDDVLMKNFEIVDDSILDKVEVGDNMDITKSIYWNALKHLDKPLNITRVIEAIKQS